MEKRISANTAKAYNYEWITADAVVANINTSIKWAEHTTCSIAQLTGETNPETYRKAHNLWLKLKDAFNAEAATYNPKAYDSKLGSVGPVERREVMRSAWWDAVSEYPEEDYDILTAIVEILHHGETLETGKILFGS